jgi:hypothetical protein
MLLELGLFSFRVQKYLWIGHFGAACQQDLSRENQPHKRDKRPRSLLLLCVETLLCNGWWMQHQGSDAKKNLPLHFMLLEKEISSYPFGEKKLHLENAVTK